MDFSSLAEQLGLIGHKRTPSSLEEAISKGYSSSDFVNIVATLSEEISEIGGVESVVHPVEDDASCFLIELNGFLKECGCAHDILANVVASRLMSNEEKFVLIEYLVSEVMTCRMLVINNPAALCSATPSTSSQPTPEASEVLKYLLIALGFPKPPADITMVQVMAKVKERIEEQKAKLVASQLSHSLLRGTLSAKEWSRLEQLDQEMFSQYVMRADMLLRRLSVTVDSFAWSDSGKKRESDLQKLLVPLKQRQPLVSRIGLEKMLAARNDLTQVEKTCDSSVRQRTQSKLNKYLMGRVPDRGGRPTEIEAPPPEMPPWQVERARGGGPRGRGDFRGGRGGGGRGGGGRGQDHRGGHQGRGDYRGGGAQHGYAGFQQQGAYGDYGGGQGRGGRGGRARGRGGHDTRGYQDQRGGTFQQYGGANQGYGGYGYGGGSQQWTGGHY